MQRFMYKGYAFTEKATEEKTRISDRYKALKPVLGFIDIKKNPKNAACDFRGSISEDCPIALSGKDILIIADNGNLCFGGVVTIVGNEFKGEYYTD